MEKQTAAQTASNVTKPAQGAVVAPQAVVPALDTEAWFLVPSGDPEPRIALAWQAKNADQVFDENIITTLPLDLLHSRSKVYVLCRKPVRGKHGGNLRPSQPIVQEIDGARLHVQTPVEELAEDMQAYGPIIVSDHWSKGARHFDSRLDRGSFVSAVGVLASPWMISWEDGNSKKDGNLPTMLYLRWV